MKQYLLPAGGNFYKVNMHSHSTLSDGKQTPEELKEAYKAAGYSAVAFTEHELMYDLSYLSDDDFIAITSFEYDVCDNEKPPFAFYDEAPHCFDHKQCVHLNLYAKAPHENAMICYNPKYLWPVQKDQEDKVKYIGEPDFKRVFTIESINEVIREAHMQGMLVVYNHPTWSLNTWDIYTKLEGLDGLEIANGASDIASDLDYTPYVYDQMARAGHRMICVAGDDNHNTAHFFKAWTMIKAESLTYENLFEGLKKGNCYASQGPEIFELYTETTEDNKRFVSIKTSPAAGIFMTTAGRRKGFKLAGDNGLISEARFEVKSEDYYFRISVRDASGKHANTRIYYLDELN